MFGRKITAWWSFISIGLGVFLMVEWQLNHQFIDDYLGLNYSYTVLFCLFAFIISFIVFIVSQDIIPVVAIYLIFFLYEIFSGLTIDRQIIYNNGISLLISVIIIFAFKRLISM